MAKVTIKKIEDDVTNRLKDMVENSKTGAAFLRLKILPYYQNLQRERWMSEGESEGESWPALTSDSYKKSKPVRFISYPGSGSKMMIATNTLFESTVTTPSTLITENSITIAVNPSFSNPETSQNVIEYAKYSADKRPFMTFGDTSIGNMKQMIKDYVSGRSHG